MKTFKLFLAVSSFFALSQAFSQNYETIYSVATTEVQAKINSNKIAGNEILLDINANHIIGITGIHISNKGALESALQSEVRILNFTLSNDVSSLLIECKASLSKDEIADILSQFNGIMIGHSVVYSVQD